mgnify:CR=1 FL=1
MSMADRDGLIWLDGEMVPWREAKTHVLTHTLHYGLGCFEGVRAYNTANGPAIFRLKEHTDRLFRSAHILNMKMPFSKDVINEAQRAAVRENNLDEAYLRPMVFLGSEGMGLRADNLQVHVMVAAWSWPSYMSPEAKELGIKVRTSSYTRHHVNITMCKAKANGNYINSMLALNEAISGGAEEALLLDNEGYVAEGSGENIFIVRNGELHTPELTSCLAGITRDTGWRDAGQFARWVRLALALSTSSIICDAVTFAVNMVLFRLYFADWYIALFLLGPGWAYVLVACMVAVPFAHSLRQVQR